MTTSLPIRAYFGDKVISSGFMAVPHLLRRHYREIGLEEETFVFVLHLLAMIWDTTAPPRSLGDIAMSMGKGLSTVRRYSGVVNQLGLVIIHERFRNGQQIGNDYDLSPLWERLAGFAPAPVDDDGVEVGRAILPVPATPEEHMFKGRSQTGGSLAQKRAPRPPRNERPTRPGMRDLARPGMSDLNKNQEDRRSEEAVVASTIFSAIISIEDASMLVAKYPACIPHATALVAQARTGRSPSGFLIHLIEHGWTPPSTARSQELRDAPDIQPCPVCGGALARCGGIHGFLAYNDGG